MPARANFIHFSDSTIVDMRNSHSRVLVLGAGMVSDPLAHYYAQQSPHITLTVAADSQTAGRRLAQIGENIESHIVDVIKEPNVIEELVKVC